MTTPAKRIKRKRTSEESDDRKMRLAVLEQEYQAHLSSGSPEQFRKELSWCYDLDDYSSGFETDEDEREAKQRKTRSDVEDREFADWVNSLGVDEVNSPDSTDNKTHEVDKEVRSCILIYNIY